MIDNESTTIDCLFDRISNIWVCHWKPSEGWQFHPSLQPSHSLRTVTPSFPMASILLASFHHVPRTFQRILIRLLLLHALCS
jgi:hypothetical protein